MCFSIIITWYTFYLSKNQKIIKKKKVKTNWTVGQISLTNKSRIDQTGDDLIKLCISNLSMNSTIKNDKKEQNY